MRPSRPVSVLATALAALICAAVPAAAGAATAPSITQKAGFSARGSVGEAYVLGAKRGERLLLADRRGRLVASGRADRFGSRIFLDVRPGAGYTVRLRRGRGCSARAPSRSSHGTRTRRPRSTAARG